MIASGPNVHSYPEACGIDKHFLLCGCLTVNKVFNYTQNMCIPVLNILID